MTGETILVLDVGLTNAKSVLFTLDGSVVGRGTARYPTHRPRQDQVEQDPGDWWQAIVAATRDLWSHDPKLPAGVCGIGVTAHMHALVCIDNSGVPIGPALILGDRRAALQALRIIEDLGEAFVYEVTGTLMDPSMPAAKIRWLFDNDRDRWRATACFTGCKDYLRSRLTGDRLTDPIDACATSIYDIQRRAWSPEIAAVAGVDIGRLPDVVAPETVAGGLLAEAAADLGLPPGIPVVVGAGDDVEVIGSGLLTPGKFLEHLGTTGSILAVTAAPPDDPARGLERYPHVVPNLWVAGGSITAAGAALGWAATTLGYPSFTVALEELKISQTNTTECIFLPNLSGKRCPIQDAHTRGAWVGLDQIDTRANMMLAAFEGVGFAMKLILGRIESLIGRCDALAVSQGGDIDDRWLQLRADIYDRPLVTLGSPEPTALGTMLVVAVGLGIHRDLTTAAGVAVKEKRRIEPHPERAARLADRYERFTALEDALQPWWPPSWPASSR